MQSFIRFFVNALYILVIIFVVLSLSAYAFVGKDAKSASDQPRIMGKVVKEEIPQLIRTQGLVGAVDKKAGERVILDEKILDITTQDAPEVTPLPTGAVDEDTANQVRSTATGTIQKILVKPGQEVLVDQAAAVVLSDENIVIALNVKEDEYEQIKDLKEFYFYSTRLDQSFAVETSLLNPSVLSNDSSSNTYQLSFTFKNPKESTSLLHNERVELMLPKVAEKHTWETILSTFRK